jgi:undecaprenyl diphosphate synthase
MTSGANYSVPNHLGLIPDGNRRWAKQHRTTVTRGHQKGYENLKDIIKLAIKDYGIKNISAYVFSSENWERDPSEVSQLMRIIPRILLREIDDLHKVGVKIKVLGSKLRIDKALEKAIKSAEEKTKNNTVCNLFLCIDYGGRQEIVDAIKKLIKSGVSPDKLTIEGVNNNLYMPDLPPLDLVIRTSGEQRLSNFMLWEAAYSELYFAEEYWPDFNDQAFNRAIDWFSNTKRRFGK